ncbi:PEP-CTERM sorting domain-containing protein [Crocosphaera sp.]|uniref:PEP-CTERM sorting domain-containing protein n=1 Tax=Crocosphaera sp. TaxID=2729996 RepID=UPI003F24615C|nr:PEP-CTERM sorting domain-containing protein [Crocosphaera sp.]
MNKLNLLSKLAIAGITGAAALAVPMNAEASVFIIDDFVSGPFGEDTPAPPNTQVCTDNIAGGDPGTCDPDKTEIDLLNTVMNDTPLMDGDTMTENGWMRTMSALRTTGDLLETEICVFCRAAHLTSGPGGGQGISSFTYTNGDEASVDLSDFEYFMFRYAADHSGGDVRLYTDVNDDGVFNTLLAEALDLPDTNGSSSPSELIPYMFPLLETLTVNDLQIQIDGQGVNDLQVTLDDAKLVQAPEPGTILGLLAISGLGFGLKRKKQS